MDRINGAGTIDIGGGNRGFKDENVPGGIDGTEVTAAYMNSVQEELIKVIEAADLEPNGGDWTQLHQAMLSMQNRSGAIIQTYVETDNIRQFVGISVPGANNYYDIWTGNFTKQLDAAGSYLLIMTEINTGLSATGPANQKFDINGQVFTGSLSSTSTTLAHTPSTASALITGLAAGVQAWKLALGRQGTTPWNVLWNPKYSDFGFLEDSNNSRITIFEIAY